MRLAPTPTTVIPGREDLATQVATILDARLNPQSDRRLAVAFSGGGDSLALLMLAADWADRHGRKIFALHLDHRLQPASRDWAHACARAAERLGVRFRALEWTGPKPAGGLPAAARLARHRLLAEAAREAGARVLLMGHTADDLIEAGLMRAAGGTTPDPFEWSPSPVWPEGRGLFVLRPLLGVRRTRLREWLTRRRASWIEDPANDDPRFGRARVRPMALASTQAPIVPRAPVLELARTAEPLGGGFLIPRAALAAAPMDEVVRLLALACVCAGGGERLPRGDRVRRLAEGLLAGQTAAATLAGARVQLSGAAVVIAREPGEARRGGLPTLALPHHALVWDGRFRLKAHERGWTVRRLAGLARQLPAAQQVALAALPPALRGGLPVLTRHGEPPTCPVLEPHPHVKAKSLTARRLAAAAGLIQQEP